MANTDLNKALIAFAMQAYYGNRLAADKKLFNDEGVSGGIRFDQSDIADSLTDIKGYANPDGGTQYFQDFLDTLPLDESVDWGQVLLFACRLRPADLSPSFSPCRVELSPKSLVHQSELSGVD
jgi:hypothetical protein